MTAGEPIYLDYNATAPARAEVIALVGEILARVGNASSVHQAGRKARARIDTARQQVADVFFKNFERWAAVQFDEDVFFACRYLMAGRDRHATLAEGGDDRNILRQ